MAHHACREDLDCVSLPSEPEQTFLLKRTADMLKRLLPLCLAVFLSTAAYADGVTIEYDENMKPGTYKTFTFIDAENNSMSSSNPAMHERAVANIKVMFIRSGIREVKANADLHVTYYAARGEDLSVHISDYGYKYPHSFMRHGNASSDLAATYEQGAIIMDVWDTKTDEVVWRGVAWKILNANPEKRGKQLDKAMESMWRKWETIKRKRKPSKE
jgi:hypothetical protein